MHSTDNLLFQVLALPLSSSVILSKLSLILIFSSCKMIIHHTHFTALLWIKTDN